MSDKPSARLRLLEHRVTLLEHDIAEAKAQAQQLTDEVNAAKACLHQLLEVAREAERDR